MITTKNNKMLKGFFLLVSLTILTFNTGFSQKKYQGLLWEISGNGLEKPSYIYGTMHVSNKVAFYLGSPFYDAIKSVDHVALELEPELWFDEVLGGDFLSTTFGMFGNRRLFGGSWNEYDNTFSLDTNVSAKVKALYKQNPAMINQLLFRMYDRTGNFEEDTWLDMYIYQTAKKFNKKTLGLETFKSSMEMMAKANEESVKEKASIRSLDYKTQTEVRDQLEPAYRNGDLDLLDSLNKLMSTPSYLKYILVERNKVFINSIDSIIKKESIFAAMGAAHLPGEEGCIEMLRAKGFTVKPIARGDRDIKQKKKIDKMIVKTTLKPYTSEDGLISFNTPYNSYDLSFKPNTAGIISMDIANGLTFTIDRVITHNALLGKTKKELMEDIDKILYEIIPGDIMSKKEIINMGNPGFNILNKTRRGDIHRSQLVFLDNEIILARLTGSGVRIKKGLGDYFFSSLQLKQNKGTDWEKRETADKSLSFLAPGLLTGYGLHEDAKQYGNVNMEFTDEKGNVYTVKRLKPKNVDYLDEDKYELYKLSEAFKKDFDLEEKTSSYSVMNNSNALTQSYSKYNGKNVFTNYRVSGAANYIFTAFCDNKSSADKFFNSVKISNPVYTVKEDYTDSTYFYSTKIPWKIEDKKLQSMFNRPSLFAGPKKKFEEAEEYSLDKYIAVPSSAEQMYVQYYRYGKYNYYADKKEFEKEIKNYATRGGDLHVEKESFVWDSTNFVCEFWLSDTGTTRRFHRKEILHNHSLYTIEATYDSTLGESAFLLDFMNNFKIIEDTACATSFFEETDKILLGDLLSSDTTRFEQANENLDLAWSYEIENHHKMYQTILDSVPPLSTEDDKKEYLEIYNSTLYADRSSKNIKALKKEYYANLDSASYQSQILNNLAAIKNVEAIKELKSILKNEAPIGVNFTFKYGLFYNLSDSLELSAKLYPDLLELTSFVEYKTPVIHLLALLVDSNLINKKVYASKIPYLVREAKAELKRLSSSYDEDDRYFKNGITDFWTVLYPYKNNPKVMSFFKATEQSKKKNVIEKYALFNLNKGTKVSDKICKSLMSTKEDEKLDNYYLLSDLERTDFLSKDIDWEKVYIEYEIENNWYKGYDEKDIDSLLFVSKREDTIRNRFYNTYCYKYLKEDKWSGVIVMIKVKEEGKQEPEFDVLRRKVALEKKDDEEKEFDELRHKLIDDNRDNRYLQNYDSYEYSESYFDF